MNAHTSIKAAPDAIAADTMAMATQDTVLSPRFYTTDFAKLDAVDVTPVRAEWDALIAEMQSDPNKTHFKRDASFDGAIEQLPPALRKPSSSTSSSARSPPNFPAASSMPRSPSAPRTRT
jgi:magnesium-protoporphyrin IX monomethyl ester (oxidative) cyclase